MTAIRFGTSGWRGRFGEEVTLPRLHVLLRAVAEWLREEAGPSREVLVGWDGRSESHAMAQSAARILVDEGWAPILADAVTPTPALTHALGRRNAAAALMLTASHNPPEDHGLKVFGASGGAITRAAIERIEAHCDAGSARDHAPKTGSLPAAFDFNAPYVDAITATLDKDALRRSDSTIVYDAMHGAGAGVLDRILEGCGTRMRRLRTTLEPGFGGASPDPSAGNLRELSRTMRAESGLRLGLATDGDADRFGIVDAQGRVLSETQVLALLVDHLAGSGRVRRGLAISAATGTLVERVAADHGLPVVRLPIGFKSLSMAMIDGRADLAGEESGGFAWTEIGLDKDGILAGCLLANLLAVSGEPLETHLARLEARHGASACGRSAIPMRPDLIGALEGLEAHPPDRIGGVSVVEVDRSCGLRLGLADGGFVMLRRSGTEAMLRVYAEVPGADGLDTRLAEGVRCLEERAKTL